MNKFLVFFFTTVALLCLVSCEFNQKTSNTDYLQRRKREIALACFSETVVASETQVQEHICSFLSSVSKNKTSSFNPDSEKSNRSVFSTKKTPASSYSITDTQTIVYGGATSFNNRSISVDDNSSLKDQDLFIYLMKVRNSVDKNFSTVICSNDKRVGSVLAFYPNSNYDISKDVTDNIMPVDENLFSQYDFEYAKIFLSSISQYVRDTIAIYNLLEEKDITEVKKSKSVMTSSNKVFIDETVLETKWHQNKPFNKVVSANEGKNVVVGCVSLACAQLAAMHQSPKECSEYPYTGVSYNWDVIKNSEYYSFSDIAQDNSVCVLFYETGLATKTDYGEKASSAFFPDSFDYFRSRGYSTPVLPVMYNIDLIKKSLIEGNPVLVGGFTSLLLNDGHAWIIDGYMKDEVGLEYVHFNLGWGGLYDGYYLNDIFESCSGFIDSLTNENNTEEIVKNYTYGIMIIPDICPK